MRADFARCGWSLQTDLGNRLKYGDAIALYETFATDPSTYTGAELLGLMGTLRWADLLTAAALGADPSSIIDALRPPKVGDAKPGAAENLREAAAGMSPIFQGLYE
jgi:hypothetical protein